MTTLPVHSIETFGTHEGPGIRLVIFTQGCQFRCLYCHNPDTQAMQGGTDMPIDELVRMALRQRAYFGKKGGVTVSGGEPTLHAQPLTELFRALRAEGIHTALDTNGAFATDEVKALYDETDLVLLDVKHINDAKHHTLTSASNASTRALAAHRESTGKPMWLRYVLVPGYSDAKEDLIALGEYFREYRHIERLEILPYHTLGAYKYEKLGRENPLKGVRPPNQASIDRAVAILERFFVRVVVRR